ncbi:MAG TPA: hypothetical protein VLH79_11140 [Chthonomonadales bacterium]|nr:hypothetical protein [Chthonomonadales bacterium]
MPVLRAVLLAGVALVLGLPADALPTIRLTVTRQAVLSDGRDFTEIVAEVRDSGGRLAPDGTTVTLTTTVGTFAQAGPTTSAHTRAGTARARLLSPRTGTAKVTAVVAGGGFQQCEVLFTDDPSQTFEGNAYVVVDANCTLLYAASERIIEAIGKPRLEDEEAPPGAQLRYRNIEVRADHLQVDCNVNVVRAVGNVVLRRGGSVLRGSQLHYSLPNGVGYAIADIDGRARPVRIRGVDLQTEELAGGAPQAAFVLEQIGDARLLVLSRQVVYLVGERLQFRRPRFYQDGAHLFSMPFFALGLYSNELFSEQFVTFGTEGLGVNVPFYYDLTPGSTGLLRLRHGERVGRSIHATRPGWALDLLKSYRSLGVQSRYTGEFGITGLARNDWGLRWSHSQEFSSATRASLFLDVPQHRALYLSSNLSRDFGGLHGGLRLSMNRSLSGIRSEGAEADAYLESMARPVGRTGYFMAVGGTTSVSRLSSAHFRSSGTMQGLQMRLFSHPFELGRTTTVTNTISLGQQWNSLGRSGGSAMFSLAAMHTFGRTGNLQATYDFTRFPRQLPSEGNHRLGFSLFAGAGSRLSLFAHSSIVLDGDTSSLTADLNYGLAHRWRFAMAANFQRFSSAQYTDWLVGIAHDIGGRDLMLSYSTLSRRIAFDIQATRF